MVWVWVIPTGSDKSLARANVRILNPRLLIDMPIVTISSFIIIYATWMIIMMGVYYREYVSFTALGTKDAFCRSTKNTYR